MDISDYPYVWAGISAWVNEPIIYIMLSRTLRIATDESLRLPHARALRSFYGVGTSGYVPVRPAAFRRDPMSRVGSCPVLIDFVVILTCGY